MKKCGIATITLIFSVFGMLSCGRADKSTPPGNSSIVPPEAYPQHAEIKYQLPPAGWTSGVVWVVAVHDTRTSATSSLEVDWVRFYCTVGGQDIMLSGETAVNGTGVDGGALYTRYPWFGNNDAHTAMSVNFTADTAMLPLSTATDKVWHFWGSRVLIPASATQCYAAARVKPNGNALVQIGLDFWIDQYSGWCGLNQCNTEGSASDWHNASGGWIIIYSGR